MSGAPLTDGKRPTECALVGTLYIWECVRSTGKEMMSRETSVEQVWEKRAFSSVRSCLIEDRSGSSEVRVPGNSGRPKVDQLRD